MKERVHLVMGFDSTFAPWARVTLASIVRHLDEGLSLVLYILDGGLSASDRASLEAEGGGRVKFLFFDMKGGVVEKWPTRMHWSPAMYYRLMIENFLPRDLGRVVYLDCDVLVRASLDKLANQELSGAIVGAIANPCDQADASRRLWLDQSHIYVNSGVLVIDWQKWLNFDVIKRIPPIISSGREIIYPDQDILNVVFSGKMSLLPTVWNVQTECFRTPREHGPALVSPSLVHFTSNSKPWMRSDPHPYRTEYRSYMRHMNLPLICGGILDFPKFIKRLASRFLVYHLVRRLRGLT